MVSENLKKNLSLNSFSCFIYFITPRSLDIQGGSKQVSCCTVSTAYFFSHPVDRYRLEVHLTMKTPGYLYSRCSWRHSATRRRLAVR